MTDKTPALMAILRSELKEIKGALAARDNETSQLVGLEQRFERFETETRLAFQGLARAIGAIHTALSTDEPLDQELLRNEVFRSFMENYPDDAVPALNQKALTAAKSEAKTFDDERLLSELDRLSEKRRSDALDPVDAYKARIAWEVLEAERLERRDRNNNKERTLDLGR